MGTRMRAREPKNIKGRLYPPNLCKSEPITGPKRNPIAAKISAILILAWTELGKSSGM